MAYPFIAACLALLPPLAQAGVQSALTPKGEHAAGIAEITWVLFIGGAAIFALVMIFLGFAMFGPARLRARLANRTVIIGGGILFPVVALTALLVYTFIGASALARGEEPAAAKIEVLGELWWWRVRYLDPDGKVLFETANDIRIPAGQPVDFLLKSDNVIHSFWVPNLAGKIDTIPGHVNRLRVRAGAPGIFRGQCAEYCGTQHAKMSFHVIALTPAAFEAWTATQRSPAVEPRDASLQAARQYFMHACARCHTIRGTDAKGTLGPDLTHVGSRHSIGAGVLPGNVGALAGWIAGSQHIKPGNKMPAFNELSGEGLRSLAHYMESLK